MQKLLNKIPVLDKGHVAIISSSMTSSDLQEIQRNYMVGAGFDSLLSMPKIHMSIKCPLFVQLNLVKFGLSFVVKKTKTLESYIPSVSDIAAKDLATSEEIRENMEETSMSLLMNPRAYSYEGCDTFISQILCPISMYNDIVISGDLDQWIRFVQQPFLPSSIDVYRKAVEELLVADWNYLEEKIKRPVK